MMTLRIHGTSPDGKTPRVLDIDRLSADEQRDRPTLSIHIHSPDNVNSGWQIIIDRSEIDRLIDLLLVSDRI